MKPLTPIGIIGPLVVSIMIASCSTPVQPSVQKDSTENEHEVAASSTGGNEVKVEAPDAITKTDQGYVMPRKSVKAVQSPINIITDSAIKDNGPDISIKFNADVNAVENLGHTVQLDFKDGSTTLAGGRTYISKQFHFHTPSEHLIDGMTYPMEMHIVSVLKDSNTQNNPHFLVLGILFKMGKENKFIQEFLNSIPKQEGKETLPAGAVKFQELFNTVPNNEPDGYYAYQGSLTTPPYSETVNWVVKKYILEASPEQISAIEKLEGNNARHVQALYARKVVSH